VRHYFAAEIPLETDSSVEISLRAGKFILVSINKPKFVLKQLFARVTKENLHHEVESGPAGRDEVW